MKMQFENRKLVLMTEFRRQMNGAVVDAMKAYSGGDVMLSYGVSLPTIKSICASVDKDNEFAKYIFHTKVRELKLSAIFLAEADKVDIEQIEKWSSEDQKDEIFMHLSSLISTTSFADSYFEKWISESRPQYIKSALLIATHKIRGGGEVLNCKELIILNLNKCDGFTLNSFVSLISRIALTDNLFAEDIINRISESDNSYHKELLSFI